MASDGSQLWVFCCAESTIKERTTAALATMSGQDTDISNMGQGGEGAGKLGSAAANVAQVILDPYQMQIRAAKACATSFDPASGSCCGSCGVAAQQQSLGSMDSLGRHVILGSVGCRQRSQVGRAPQGEVRTLGRRRRRRRFHRRRSPYLEISTSAHTVKACSVYNVISCLSSKAIRPNTDIRLAGL